MPVSLDFSILRLSQSEFGEISYEVMNHVFAIHNQFGGFFNEAIYKHELARRLPGTELEKRIDIWFESFRTHYLVDVIVGEGAIFEFKAVENLKGVHRAQLMNYLLLCDVAHGKLVNVRNESVEHEFVNVEFRYADSKRFKVVSDRWNCELPGAEKLRDYCLALVSDLGAGLETSLYGSAIQDFLGGMDRADIEVPVRLGGRLIGQQRMTLLEPDIAIRISGLDQSLKTYEAHARQLLAHTDMRAILWINITQTEVSFVTLNR